MAITECNEFWIKIIDITCDGVYGNVNVNTFKIFGLWFEPT